jgi:uncharacterized membrane protein YphA (DoxX/SURF4 family)
MNIQKSEQSYGDAFKIYFQYFLTALRILIGWHFAYEGVTKLFIPGWSSAGYLMESQWFLSGFFHNLASNDFLLKLVDFLNVWGLILIGLGLMLGLFTRIASGAGAFLLLLYYIANPPFIGFVGENTGEGQYLIINKTLIETVILFLFAFLPSQFTIGIDRLIKRVLPKFSSAKVKDTASETGASEINTRRELIKDLISLPVLGAFTYSLIRKKQWESFEERILISEPSRVDATSGASSRGISFSTLKELEGSVPKGKIGNYEISRIIAGGNLISGFAHSRDLIYVSHLVNSYFTDEKVLETMKICEACGINTIILRVDINTLRIMEKYRRRDGKMHWIAQCKITDNEISPDIDTAINNGAMGTYIHGGICDDIVNRGKTEILCETIKYIKNKGVLAGLAGHDLRVIMSCEEHGAEPDFYMKTLNSGNYWTAGPRLITKPDWKPNPEETLEPEFNPDVKDNMWSTTPQQTIEFMNGVKKPWIAYKVLGAGAIHPKEGFRYAFENGADFCCVGMFDWQVVEDSNIAINLLKENLSRNRLWFA